MFNLIGRGRWGAWAGVVAAAVLAFVGAMRAGWADQGDPPEVEAQRLAHLMSYVAGDYGGAVADGVVTSQAEYDEQRALIKEAAGIAGRLDAAAKPAGVPVLEVKLATLVGEVAAKVEAKGAESEVAGAATKVRSAALLAFGVSETPKELPNPMRGKNLYHELCADCHGAAGRGDGAKGKGLDPKPADYLREGMEERLAPSRVAATIRFGVSGTAMVPFNQLSEEDRYAIAFYVLGLRHQEAEPVGDGAAYGLSYLATHTDAEIERDLLGAGVEKGRVAGVMADRAGGRLMRTGGWPRWRSRGEGGAGERGARGGGQGAGQGGC
ncbi:MAG: cytochrome c [Polyangiaceae bacterium]